MHRMASEIERKFLVASPAWRALSIRNWAIRQFYLVLSPDRSVRVRVRDGKTASLTVKLGCAGLVRQELEFDLSVAEARSLERFAHGQVIAKTRHQVPVGDAVFEVDVFEAALAGLILAEVELPASGVWPMLPTWLGREVTGEERFYNAALAGQIGHDPDWAAA